MITNVRFLCPRCRNLASYTEKTASGTRPICASCIAEYGKVQTLKDSLVKLPQKETK